MLIADGGGGYAGTDWNSKDVKFMWAMIADQDTDVHFGVVDGWHKTSDLINEHISRMTTYREELAAAWPPEKSPASAAYIAQLDGLIKHLQGTLDAASANYKVFSTVTLTLALARTKLQPILAQYEANEQLNLNWQADKDATPTPAPKTNGTPTPSPSPSPSPVAPVPPVSAAQQEQLNNQARAIMYDLSSTVISGQSELKQPAPYQPVTGTYGGTEGERDGSNTDSSYPVAPIIPPPGAVNGSSGSTYTPALTPSTSSAPTPSGSTGVGAIGGGPILGGVSPTPVVNPPGTGLPSIPTPVPSSPTPPGAMPGLITPPGVSGIVPSNGLLPNGARPPAGGSLKPGIGRMAIPSGGVIGAMPGSGMIGQIPGGGPGRPSGSARVNPVGGVIGQQGAVQPGSQIGRGSTTGRPSVGAHGMAVQPSQGRRGRHDGDNDQNHWDPDNPWATEAGGAPVLLPPDDPGPIDPGPAIGYSR